MATQMTMSITRRSAIRQAVWLMLAYGLLSWLWYALSFYEIDVQTGHRIAMFMWIFGPTATLVGGSRSFTLYLEETLVIGALVFLSIGFSRHSYVLGALLWLITAIAWLLCSAMLYTLAM
jgi:hypothetical protein